MTLLGIEQFLIGLGLATILIPIIQLLIGGIPTILKRWFLEKKEFSKRVNFLCEKLTEDMSISLYQIFDRALNKEINLRGQLPESPDLLNPYHRLIESNTIIIFKLKGAYKKYKMCNTLLFYIALVGLILSVLVFFKLYLIYVLGLSLFLILIELILIQIMYNKTEVLEDFEHIHLKTGVK